MTADKGLGAVLRGLRIADFDGSRMFLSARSARASRPSRLRFSPLVSGAIDLALEEAVGARSLDFEPAADGMASLESDFARPN